MVDDYARLDTEKMRRLREALGWTHREAADAAGFKTAPHWTMIETGKQGGMRSLGRIAHALRVHPCDLLLYKPPGPKPKKGAKS